MKQVGFGGKVSGGIWVGGGGTCCLQGFASRALRGGLSACSFWWMSGGIQPLKDLYADTCS